MRRTTGVHKEVRRGDSPGSRTVAPRHGACRVASLALIFHAIQPAAIAEECDQIQEFHSPVFRHGRSHVSREAFESYIKTFYHCLCGSQFPAPRTIRETDAIRSKRKNRRLVREHILEQDHRCIKKREIGRLLCAARRCASFIDEATTSGEGAEFRWNFRPSMP